MARYVNQNGSWFGSYWLRRKIERKPKQSHKHLSEMNIAELMKELVLDEGYRQEIYADQRIGVIKPGAREQASFKTNH